MRRTQAPGAKPGRSTEPADWSVGMDRMMACQANDIRRELHRQLTYPTGVLSAFLYADATPEDDATYRNVTLLLAAPALRSIRISMR